MKTTKVLAAFLSAAMVITSAMIPVFADEAGETGNAAKITPKEGEVREYDSFEEAFDAVNRYDTLTLFKDAKVDQELKFDWKNNGYEDNCKDMTLDLNGNTLTVPSIYVEASNVTIKNGTLKMTDEKSTGGIYTTDIDGNGLVLDGVAMEKSGWTDAISLQNINITIRNCEINAPEGTAISITDSRSWGPVGIAIEDSVINASSAAIKGAAGWDYTTINISGDKTQINSENNIAIYHPQDGDLTITGGVISGTDGINFYGKGNINISGGEFTATGRCDSNFDKFSPYWHSGAALFIASRDTGSNSYGAANSATLNISGGTFVSEQNSALYERTIGGSGSLLKLGEGGSSITGGTFISGANKEGTEEKLPGVSLPLDGANAEDKKIIKGGTYSGNFDDIKDNVDDEYGWIKSDDGQYDVVNYTKIAKNVTLSLDSMVSPEPVALAEIDETDPYTYAVKLTADDGSKMEINRYMAAELTLQTTGSYEVLPCDNATVVDLGADEIEGTHKYGFYMNGAVDGESGNGITWQTGHEIIIGYIRITGYGPYSIKIVNGVVQTAMAGDNIVDTYSTGAEGDGKLSIQPADGEGAGDGEAAKGDRTPTVKELTINVMFPNKLADDPVNMDDMTVTVKGGNELDDEGNIKPFERTISLAYEELTQFNYNDPTEVPEGTGNANGYKLTVDVPVPDGVGTRFTFTFKGLGYRTYSVDAVIESDDENPTVTVWNNVMDSKTLVVSTDPEYVTIKTFLAGDIVKDETINLYDLSAVVAYFGRNGMTAANKDYIQYDLNRDGNVDSKDIAMVLVSWGN